jgi:hypothetical protein
VLVFTLIFARVAMGRLPVLSAKSDANQGAELFDSEADVANPPGTDASIEEDLLPEAPEVIRICGGERAFVIAREMEGRA